MSTQETSLSDNVPSDAPAVVERPRYQSIKVEILVPLGKAAFRQFEGSDEHPSLRKFFEERGYIVESVSVY